MTPCFTCALPDCDEHAPGCALRRLSNAADRKRRTGRHDAITPAEQQAFNALWKIQKLDRQARLAETPERTAP